MAPDLKIKATNYAANLIATPKNTKFHPIINFLNNCPLTHALTATPTMNQHALMEYWSTASTTSGLSYLSGQVNGKELRFTSTTLATALQLPTDPTDQDPPSKEQIWEMLEAIGYEENNPKLGSISRNKMSPCWSFFFFVLIKCLSGKTGAWDQAAGLTLHLAYGLIMGKKIHYAKLIFEDICRKVGNGTLIYPRFLSLMIQTQLQGEILTPVLELPVCFISAKFYRNKIEEKGEKPLTTAMLSLIPPPRVSAPLEGTKMSKPRFYPPSKERFSPPSKESRRASQRVPAEMADKTVDKASESYKDLVVESREIPVSSNEIDTKLLAKQRPTAKGKDVAEVISGIRKRVEKLRQKLGSLTSVDSQKTEEIADDKANLSEIEASGSYKALSGSVLDSSDFQKSVIEELSISDDGHILTHNSPQRPLSPQQRIASAEDEHLDSDAESHNTAFNDPTLEERICALEAELFMIREKRSSVNFVIICVTLTVYVVLMEVLGLVLHQYGA